MNNLRTSHAILAAGLVLMLGLAGPGAAEQPANFQEALAAAAELDQPIVLDFFTEW